MSLLIQRIIRNKSTLILLIFYLMLIVITAFFLTYSYYSQLSQIKTQRKGLLLAVAGGAASGIDGDRHNQILIDNPNKDDINVRNFRQDSNYLAISNMLNRIQSVNKMTSPIYTMVYDTTKGYFRYVVRSDEKFYYKHEYKQFPKELLTNYNKGGVLEPYYSENGQWISAYYPIRNKLGHVVGLVQADEKFEVFIKNVNERFIRFMIICILFILCLTVVLLPIISRMLTKDEKIMRQLVAQKKELERVNQDLNDSVKYASSMQKAISPSVEIFNETFSDHFVLNLPKDVVSGDFYWMHKAENGDATLIVSDCTGHGVPGAMMSMMGITILNSIAHKKKNFRADSILNNLDNEVEKLLSKSNNEYSHYDGMDIGVLRIEQDKLNFAGAMSGIVLQDDLGEYNLIKGDRFPIGGKGLYDKTPFTLKDLDYHSGKWVYLFSDGYQDQFSEATNKKFTRKRFLNKLKEVQDLSGIQQHDELKSTIKSWMGNSEQIDDILVVGIKLH